jgi:CHASE3 domain sensor protein
MPSTLPQDADKLRELRKNISMELLWVQQAIDSRKNVSLFFIMFIPYIPVL